MIGQSRSERFLWATTAVCGTWCFSVPGAAQTFQSLSTTEDGSTVYFSSPIREKGTDQSFHSKIFRWDPAGGIRVIAESPDTGEFDGCTTANFYQLQSPQVSSDGTVLVYTGNRPVSYTQACPVNVEANQALVQRLGVEVRLPGNIVISPNGRYAITMPVAAVTNNFHVVTDLVSGVSSIVAGAFNGSVRQVTDEATVVIAEESAVILADRSGGTRVLQTTWPVNDVVIDRSGKTVVYATAPYPGVFGRSATEGRITGIDVATGFETEVLTGLSAPGNLGSLSVTSDGAYVLFTSTSQGSGSQLYVIGIGGGVARPIAQAPDSIDNVVVSGDGLVGYAGSDRLVRIDLTSGAVTELASVTPLLTTAYRVWPADPKSPGTTVAAVGSLMVLGGSGLESIRQIALCGRSVPFVPFSIFGPRFQVPWDLPEGPCQAIAQSDSPFEHAIDLEVREYDPQFELGVLLHDNFRSITSSSPAHPGEVIVAYMTGLGPVDDDGGLKPGFNCSFDSTQAEILYAQLAAGLTGAYQVNIRVPNLNSDFASLSCGWDLATRASTAVWLAPL
jgi:uncharacterized protein (TIGR03437 family)